MVPQPGMLGEPLQSSAGARDVPIAVSQGAHVTVSQGTRADPGPAALPLPGGSREGKAESRGTGGASRRSAKIQKGLNLESFTICVVVWAGIRFRLLWQYGFAGCSAKHSVPHLLLLELQWV